MVTDKRNHYKKSDVQDCPKTHAPSDAATSYSMEDIIFPDSETAYSDQRQGLMKTGRRSAAERKTPNDVADAHKRVQKCNHPGSAFNQGQLLRCHPMPADDMSMLAHTEKLVTSNDVAEIKTINILDIDKNTCHALRKSMHKIPTINVENWYIIVLTEN